MFNRHFVYIRLKNVRIIQRNVRTIKKNVRLIKESVRITQSNVRLATFIKYHVMFSNFFINDKNYLKITFFIFFENLISNKTLLKQRFRDITTYNVRNFEITLTLNEFIIFSFFEK